MGVIVEKDRIDIFYSMFG